MNIAVLSNIRRLSRRLSLSSFQSLLGSFDSPVRFCFTGFLQLQQQARQTALIIVFLKE